MSDTPLEIACSARRDYLPHAATMIASLLANAAVELRVNLLIGNDIDTAETDAVEQMVGDEGELVVRRIEPGRLEHLRTTGTLPTSHWYRVLLPELLDVPRALYLDADVIVVDSLQPLAELDLAGSWLAAVSNPFPDPAGATRHCHALGVSPERYFNSGVMVLDLETMRANDVPAEVIAYGTAHAERMFLPEQDAMNAILADRRLDLAPRWNSMIGIERLAWSRDLFGEEAVREALERPAIRHFEGSGANKPWHPQATESSRRLYETYRRRTPWPDTDLPEHG